MVTKKEVEFVSEDESESEPQPAPKTQPKVSQTFHPQTLYET